MSTIATGRPYPILVRRHCLTSRWDVEMSDDTVIEYTDEALRRRGVDVNVWLGELTDAAKAAGHRLMIADLWTYDAAVGPLSGDLGFNLLDRDAARLLNISVS